MPSSSTSEACTSRSAVRRSRREILVAHEGDLGRQGQGGPESRHPVRLRPSPGDDELDSRGVSRAAHALDHQVEPLLAGESSHRQDEHAAAVALEAVGAAGAEPVDDAVGDHLGRHAEPVPAELVERELARADDLVGPVVEGAEEEPVGRGVDGPEVEADVVGEVLGLHVEPGHERAPEPARQGRRADAEGERELDVHHVGPADDVLEHPSAWPREGKPHLPHHLAEPRDVEAREDDVVLRRVARLAGGDDGDVHPLPQRRHESLRRHGAAVLHRTVPDVGDEGDAKTLGRAHPSGRFQPVNLRGAPGARGSPWSACARPSPGGGKACAGPSRECSRGRRGR